MDVPELALVLGTAGGFSRFRCQFMESKRVIENYVANFSSVDVLFSNLWICFTNISAAIRSLVIGEVHKY